MIKPLSTMQGVGLVCLFFLLSLSTIIAEISLGELNIVARRWGVDQGHIGITSKSLAQTPDGSIWVGSHNGLYQLKGQQISHFNTVNIPGVNHRDVNRLCVDPKGHLWMTTPKHTISRYHAGNFQLAPLPKKPGAILCWCPHPEEGVVGCYLRKGVITIYRITLDKCLTLFEGKEITPRSLHMSSENQLWIAMRNGTVAKLSKGILTPLPTSAIQKIGGFLTRRDQSLLAFGNEGTYLLKEGRWEISLRFSTPIPSRFPAGIGVEDQDGRLWLSAGRAGLWVCQQDGSLQKITPGRNSIPGTVGHLLTDLDGNIWVDTFSGLYQLRYSPLVTWPVPTELTSNRVLSVKTDSQGEIWFSCFGGIARLRQGKDNTELIIPRPIVEVTQFAPENSCSIWFGNKDLNFFHWNGTGITPVFFPRVHRALVPTGMEIDHQQRVWLTGHAGVFRCDPRQRPLAFKKVSGTEGLPDDVYQSLCIDDDGSIYLCARKKGLFHLKKNSTRWTPFSEKAPQSISHGGPIAPDPDGRVWQLCPKWPIENGGQGALGLITENEHLTIPLEDLGIEAHLANSIALDQQDGLWIQTTTNGLFRLGRSELLKRIRDPSISLAIARFGLPEGLKSMGGTFTQNGLQCSPDGRIWAATHEGLSSISPERWIEETQQVSAPKLFLEQIRIDSKLIPLSTSGLFIPPNAFSLEIDYDALSFDFPSEIHFKHRLVGLSEYWQEGLDGRTAAYQNLPPGDYQFEVMSTDRFGTWSGTSLALPITVSPYWWERRGVQISILIFIAALCLLLVHFRLRSWKRKNALQENFSRQLISSQEQERKRIAGELHDSLGQILLVVKNLAVLGVKKQTVGPSLYPEIAETAGEALEQVRSISRDLRPPELDHLGITKALTATIGRVENSTTINFTSHVEELAGLLSPDQEICLYRILQECLNNILKHAGANEVIILVSHKLRSVDLLIEDDGRGFRLNDLKQKGIGLRNMRDRALLARGVFHLDSNLDNGTRCHLALPLRVVPS